MASSLSHFLLFSLLATFAAAQRASWIYPPIAGDQYDYKDNEVWEVGSTQTLKWQTSMATSTATIYMYQELVDQNGGAGGGRKNIASDIEGSEFVWIVDLTAPWSLSNSSLLPVFFMGLQVSQPDGNGVEVTAHYHNITNKRVASLSSSSTSTSATLTSTPTSSGASGTTTSSLTTTSGSVTGTSTSTQTPSPASAGLSTGAVAGISVGVTIVGMAAIAGLVFWLWRRKRQAKAQAQAKTPYNNAFEETYGDRKVVYAQDWEPAELSNGPDAHKRAEMPEERVFELSGSDKDSAATVAEHGVEPRK